ncbi:MAG: hypothetical protein ABIE03_04400 [Patescibacteria group bacterium]|nr:hypothetical protein [Patescibacteria group bacterium]
MKIPSGNYFIKMFLLEIQGKFTKYIAVLSRTDRSVLGGVAFEQLE